MNPNISQNENMGDIHGVDARVIDELRPKDFKICNKETLQ